MDLYLSPSKLRKLKLYLASVAEQTGLSLTWLETLKTRFLMMQLSQ